MAKLISTVHHPLLKSYNLESTPLISLPFNMLHLFILDHREESRVRYARDL
jgi:hypothetical protein